MRKFYLPAKSKGEKMENEIISKELLQVLACPVCKKDVELVQYQQGSHGLKCVECRRIYPIREGIPIMLVDEAIQSS